MTGLFENYRIALLDASFFVSPFPESVQRSLQDINVYVADTFRAEIEQYKAILSPHRSSVYEDNIAFLNCTKQLKTLNLNSFGDRGTHIHNDTWGVLTLLVEMNAKFVLITADQLLIQRVVLHNLPVDIYDLNKNAFSYYSEFPLYGYQFELTADASEAAFVDRSDFAAEKSVLYRRIGSPVVLGPKIKSGLEATLFHAADNPDLIVKVFKKGRLSASKFNNIVKLQNANRILDISWALFPIDIVFYDAECSIPAGFTESYAVTFGDLDENPLYLGNVDLPDEYLGTHLSSSLELCLQIVRQVRYLNRFGFLVSDFNMGNFALSRQNSVCVQMWDTDSFGYETFFSGYCAGCKTGRDYDIATKVGAIDYCNEALYLFAFSLLSLGDAPISEFTRKFKFDNPAYAAKYRKYLFPENLWQLFEDVFRGKKEPSAEVLLQQLHLALQKCRTCPAVDMTYKELLGTVIEESVDDSSSDAFMNDRFEQPPEIFGDEEPDKKLPKWLTAVVITAAASFVLFLMLLVFSCF